MVKPEALFTILWVVWLNLPLPPSIQRGLSISNALILWAQKTDPRSKGGWFGFISKAFPIYKVFKSEFCKYSTAPYGEPCSCSCVFLVIVFLTVENVLKCKNCSMSKWFVKIFASCGMYFWKFALQNCNLCTNKFYLP